MQVDESTALFRMLLHARPSRNPVSAEQVPPIVYFFVGERLAITTPADDDYSRPYWDGYMEFQHFNCNFVMEMSENCTQNRTEYVLSQTIVSIVL